MPAEPAPGQAAAAAWQAAQSAPGRIAMADDDYDRQPGTWDAVADAAISAAHLPERLAKGNARLREEAASLRGQLERVTADFEDLQATQDRQWARCPDGCGCRLGDTLDGAGDADRADCGCEGPCTMECAENGYPDAPSYRDLAVRAERERIHRLALDLRATFTTASGKMLPFEELIRRSPEENAALLLGVVKDRDMASEALEGGGGHCAGCRADWGRHVADEGEYPGAEEIAEFARDAEGLADD